MNLIFPKMMLDVSETMKDDRILMDVKVHKAAMENDSYVSYEITLETNDPSFSLPMSSIRRRYSDFTVLRKLLTRQFPLSRIPTLPPKQPFKNSFDPDLIQKRQNALQDFLKKLVADRLYLSSKALHLFLQSDFPLTKIKDIVEGKISAEEIQSDMSSFQSSVSLNDDESGSQLSSEFISEESNSNSCAILKPSSESNMNSTLENKRVSFCDQVTVAEVHSS